MHCFLVSPSLKKQTNRSLFFVPIRKRWKSIDLSSSLAHKNGCRSSSTRYSKGKASKRKTWGRSRAYFLSVPTRSSSPFPILLAVSCRWLENRHPQAFSKGVMIPNDYATGMRRPQHPEACSGSQLLLRGYIWACNSAERTWDTNSPFWLGKEPHHCRSQDSKFKFLAPNGCLQAVSFALYRLQNRPQGEKLTPACLHQHLSS